MSPDETPRGHAALPPQGTGTRHLARVYRRLTVAHAQVRRAAPWNGLRILCYHRTCDARDVLAVSPAMFRRQLEYALATGASPVRLADALAASIPRDAGRSFSVTFDDGYKDLLDGALPVLQALSIPATVYLPTAIISGTARLTWYREQPRMLDWSGVRELLACGLVDAAAHSRTHPALPRLDEAAARAEIVGSREDLAERLGRVPATFGYPAGLYGAREQRLVEEAGFEGAVTVHAGVNTEDADRFALARTVVYGGEALPAFAARFDGRLDSPSRLRTRVLRRRAGGIGFRPSGLH